LLKVVYICLGVAFVSLALLIYLAIDSGRYFHGTTSHMLETLQSDAAVLDADKYGSVVQTGNGRVLGFKRGQSEPVWETSFDRFKDSLGWQSPPPNAQAWCVGRCPASVVEIEGHYSARGGAPQAIAEPLSSTSAVIGTTTDGLLAVVDGRTTLLQADRTTEVPAPDRPTAGYADSSTTRIVTGSVSNDSRTLARFERDGSEFREAADALDIPTLGNLCISPDGEAVGAIGDSILLGAFGDAKLKTVGTEIASGVCRADAKGFTAVVNPLVQRSHVAASRFRRDGSRIWTRTLGARRLISPGPSPLVVTLAPDGTVTALDAVTGEPLMPMHFNHTVEPLVGDDGSLVTAARDGTPAWHEFKRSNGRTAEADR
jgi:hypothetical protein